MPTVSIILTSYNHGLYIRQAIESAISQSFTDFELIIADDGSTDDSWEIIQSYDDPRIITHRRDVNQGGGLIREVLPRCKGKYIAIHHSDDTWEQDKISKQVAYLDSNPEITACFTHVQFINELGEKYTPPETDFYYDRFDQPNRNRFEWLRFFWDHGNALCHPSVLIRTEAYSRHGIFSTGLRQIPDFLMWIRVCLGGDIYVIQEKLTNFRLHTISSLNTSGDRPDSHIRSVTEFFLICDDLFKVSGEQYFSHVFPEYQNQILVPEFALSRLMIDKGNCAAQLYGLKAIFGLLNNPKSAQEIQNIHNYGHQDFIRHTGIVDAFSIMKDLTFLHSTLYIDYGAKFNESDKINERIYVRTTGEFSVKFSVTNDAEVLALRFDPDEGRLWDIALDSVLIDGVMVEASAMNASSRSKDFDSFSTYDPMYSIPTPTNFCDIEIMGRLRPLSVQLFELIENENDSLKLESYRLSDENASLQAANTDFRDENTVLHDERIRLIDENARLHSENVQLLDENVRLDQSNVDMSTTISTLADEKAHLQSDLDTIRSSRLLRFTSMFAKCRSLFKVNTD